MLRDLISQFGNLPTGALLAVVFAFAFAETALFLDVVVPGEVGMVLAGAAAAEAGTPLALVVAAGIVGATLGDTTSYWIGRTTGPRLVHHFRWTRRRFGPALERGRRYFDRSGNVAIVGGRFVGALRAVVPFVAGSVRMPFRRFLVWNVVASVCWATAVIGAGYVFGERIAATVDGGGRVLSAAVVAVLGAGVLWRRRRRTLQKDRTTGT